ncbi:MAG TPA: DNA-directed RNA polymerase subunit omega [Pyrinomonadaceae bacterium]|jgi:DNA-directed RNA polymerase omega subunit
MAVTNKVARAERSDLASGEQWPGIVSRFQLIILAAQRNKQLLRGARPRIEADTLRRRNTSIALEEVRQGLVPFTNDSKERGPALAETEAQPDTLL